MWRAASRRLFPPLPPTFPSNPTVVRWSRVCSRIAELRPILNLTQPSPPLHIWAPRFANKMPSWLSVTHCRNPLLRYWTRVQAAKNSGREDARLRLGIWQIQGAPPCDTRRAIVRSSPESIRLLGHPCLQYWSFAWSRDQLHSDISFLRLTKFPLGDRNAERSIDSRDHPYSCEHHSQVVVCNTEALEEGSEASTDAKQWCLRLIESYRQVHDAKFKSFKSVEEVSQSS